MANPTGRRLARDSRRRPAARERRRGHAARVRGDGFFTVVGHGVVRPRRTTAGRSRRFFDETEEAGCGPPGRRLVGLPVTAAAVRAAWCDRRGRRPCRLKESLDWGPSLAGVDWPAGRHGRMSPTAGNAPARSRSRRDRGGARPAAGLIRGPLHELCRPCASSTTRSPTRRRRRAVARGSTRLRLPDILRSDTRRVGSRCNGLARLGRGTPTPEASSATSRPAFRPDPGRVDVDLAPNRGSAGRAALLNQAVDRLLRQPGRRSSHIHPGQGGCGARHD